MHRCFFQRDIPSISSELTDPPSASSSSSSASPSNSSTETFLKSREQQLRQQLSTKNADPNVKRPSPRMESLIRRGLSTLIDILPKSIQNHYAEKAKADARSVAMYQNCRGISMEENLMKGLVGSCILSSDYFFFLIQNCATIVNEYFTDSDDFSFLTAFNLPETHYRSYQALFTIHLYVVVRTMQEHHYDQRSIDAAKLIFERAKQDFTADIKAIGVSDCFCCLFVCLFIFKSLTLRRDFPISFRSALLNKLNIIAHQFCVFIF
jgi:hypothetical protein